MIKLRWCYDKESCDVAPHVENCPKCFGFGLRVDETTPITADQADIESCEGVPCDVCGGVPDLRVREKLQKEQRPL